jgi:hypothetical protein
MSDVRYQTDAVTALRHTRQPGLFRSSSDRFYRSFEAAAPVNL